MRLILHAGTHKTGTTSIQKVLRENQQTLAKGGYWYPWGEPYPKSSFPHHQFSHDLTGVDPNGIARSQRFIEVALETAADAHTMIISAESIYRHVSDFNAWLDYPVLQDYWDRRSAYLARLAALFEGMNSEVILFFRNKPDFIHSLVAELERKKNWHGTDADFAGDFPQLLEYERQSDLFRAHFGKLTVVSYEDAMKTGGSVPAFFEAIGCPVPEGWTDTWERRTKCA